MVAKTITAKLQTAVECEKIGLWTSALLKMAGRYLCWSEPTHAQSGLTYIFLWILSGAFRVFLFLFGAGRISLFWFVSSACGHWK